MKKFFWRIFKKNPPNPPPVEGARSLNMPELSPSQMEAMVQMIGMTQEVEISCDEVHRLLDQFAEMALRGEDTAQLLPLVHHHLALCPDCREEYEALMRILQASPE